MITRLHAHTARPGLSKMSHHVSSVTSENSGTVSPIFGFARDDEIPLAEYTVFDTDIFKRIAICSCASREQMRPHTFIFADDGRTPIVG